MALRQLTDDVYVGGQITPADLEALISAGVKTIINNRPDGEAPGQPSADALGDAVKAAGLSYAAIPMQGLDMALIEVSLEAYAKLPRPIAAFCASGTRSTVLWCFAHVKELGVDGVLETANQAGYALPQIRPALEGFASPNTL